MNVDTSVAQKSNMEKSNSDLDNLPWTRCIMGCTPDEDKEVILLSCFHTICSDKCSARFLAELKPGSLLTCRICNTVVSRNRLSTKIVPRKEFPGKTVLTIPDPICDNCVFDRPASKYCPECPASLCEACSILHPETRVTQKHKLQPDLVDFKNKKLTKLKEETSKCQNHKETPLTHLCTTCGGTKICKECLSAHDGHATFHMEKARKAVIASVKGARDYLEKCNQAVKELQKKREEILSEEWDTVMTAITNQFAVMLSVLYKRQGELQRETKNTFLKRLSSLGTKVDCIQQSNTCFGEFVKSAELMITDMDETASVHYKIFAKGILQQLAEISKALNQDFEKFIDRDWHFDVDDSASIQMQTYLKDFCHVEYKHQPPIKFTLKTYTGGKKNGSLDSCLTKNIDKQKCINEVPEAIGNSNENLASSPENSDKQISDGGISESINNENSGDRLKDSRPRRFAVKSTSKGEGVYNNLRFPPRNTYTKKNRTGQLQTGSDSPAYEESTLNEGLSKTTTKDGSSEPLREPEPTLGTSRVTRSKAPTTRLASPSKPSKESDNDILAMDIKTVENQVPTVQHPSPTGNLDESNSNVSSNTNTNKSSLNNNEPTSVPERPSETKKVDSPKGNTNYGKNNNSNIKIQTLCGEETQTNGTAGARKANSSGSDPPPQALSTENGGSHAKDSAATATSPSAAPSEKPELGLGKRERKRKNFGPGFLETEEFRKQVRKQELLEEAADATKRKSSSLSTSPAKAHPGHVDAKMPRLVKEVENGKEKGDKNIHSSLKIGKVLEEANETSSDGYASESGDSTRRQPVRQEADQTPSDKSQLPDQTATTKELIIMSHEPISNVGHDELDNKEGETPIIDPIEYAFLEEMKFDEAPRETIENPSEHTNFPVHGQGSPKSRNEHDDGIESEDYCCICMDGGEEIIICCDYCPKVFHLNCHLPVVPEEATTGDEKWKCNYDISKQIVEDQAKAYPADNSSDYSQLRETNKKQFGLACKFVMEVYRIPEIATMRWRFPSEYLRKFGKVPINLKYIRQRLSMGVPQNFSNVRDMLNACEQMFSQAFLYYRNDDMNHPYAVTCFEKFLALVNEYYPQYKEMFDSVKRWS